MGYLYMEWDREEEMARQLNQKAFDMGFTAETLLLLSDHSAEDSFNEFFGLEGRKEKGGAYSRLGATINIGDGSTDLLDEAYGIDLDKHFDVYIPEKV